MKTKKRKCLGCGLGNALSSLSALKSEVDRCGHHFFERDAMRFFRSKVEPTVYPSSAEKATYFVTSEQFSDETPRLWSVRRFKDCHVRTVGEFQKYRNAADAKAAARRAAGR